jgi:hypothetical protein
VIVEVVDAVRDLLPFAAGVVVDDTATEPFKPQPNRLYLWPRRLAPQSVGVESGQWDWDKAVLMLRALYVLPSKGEPRVQKAERDLSIALDAAAVAMAGAIDANRIHPMWWHMGVTNVVPDAVRTFAVRGYGLDIAVHVNAPLPVGGSGS